MDWIGYRIEALLINCISHLAAACSHSMWSMRTTRRSKYAADLFGIDWRKRPLALNERHHDAASRDYIMCFNQIAFVRVLNTFTLGGRYLRFGVHTSTSCALDRSSVLLRPRRVARVSAHLACSATVCNRFNQSARVELFFYCLIMH